MFKVSNAPTCCDMLSILLSNVTAVVKRDGEDMEKLEDHPRYSDDQPRRVIISRDRVMKIE